MRIKKLNQIKLNELPQKVRVFVDQDIEGEIPIAEIENGQMIVVAEENTLSHDVQIANGSAFVDLSFYGIQEPKSISSPQLLLSGTLVSKGRLLASVCNKTRESALHQYIRFLQSTPKPTVFLLFLFFTCLICFVLQTIMGEFSLHSIVIALLANLWFPLIYLIQYLMKKNQTLYASQGSAFHKAPKKINDHKVVYLINTYESSIDSTKKKFTILENSDYETNQIFSLFMPLARKIDKSYSIQFLKEGLSKQITFEILSDFKFDQQNNEYTATVMDKKLSWNIKPENSVSLKTRNKNSYYLIHELKIDGKIICYLEYEFPLIEEFIENFKEYRSQFIFVQNDGSLFCDAFTQIPNMHIVYLQTNIDYENLALKFKAEGYELIEIKNFNSFNLKTPANYQYGIAPYYGKDGSFYYVNSLSEQLFSLELQKDLDHKMNTVIAIAVIWQLLVSTIAVIIDYPVQVAILSFMAIFFVTVYSLTSFKMSNLATQKHK
ncbi:MAG: hypothetical protein M9962_08330 [Oligoflexia bacterium]|nr:hypothetical protein [Oligoflexia bacterium]